jgi:hypothetical protein
MSNNPQSPVNNAEPPKTIFSQVERVEEGPSNLQVKKRKSLLGELFSSQKHISNQNRFTKIDSEHIKLAPSGNNLSK